VAFAPGDGSGFDGFDLAIRRHQPVGGNGGRLLGCRSADSRNVRIDGPDFWLLVFLGRNAGFQQTLLQFLPDGLMLLVVAKFVLAQGAFRACLKRQLLTRPAVLKYLGVWTALAALLIVPTVAVYQARWAASLSLVIILLLPLARIGFSPLALGRGRHG
jgi:hypothetical protein